MKKFYPLITEQWVEMCHDLSTLSEVQTLYYIRSIDPYGDGIKICASEIAKVLKLNRSTVSRALKSLDAKGYIDLEILTANATIKGKGVTRTNDAAIVKQQKVAKNVAHTQQKQDKNVAHTQQNQQENLLHDDQKCCTHATPVAHTQQPSSESQSQQGFQKPKTNKTKRINIDRLLISKFSEIEISENFENSEIEIEIEVKNDFSDLKNRAPDSNLNQEPDRNLDPERQDLEIEFEIEIDKISENEFQNLETDQSAQVKNSEFEINKISEKPEVEIATHKILEFKTKNSEIENSSLNSILKTLKLKNQSALIQEPEIDINKTSEGEERRIEFENYQESEPGDTLTDLKAGSERTFSVKSGQIGDGKISPPTDIELFAFVKHTLESEGRDMRNPEIYVKTAINRGRSEWIKRYMDSQRASRPVETWKPTPLKRPDPEVAAREIAKAKAMLAERHPNRFGGKAAAKPLDAAAIEIERQSQIERLRERARA